MELDTCYTRQWVTGTIASRELRHRIPRTICGLQCGTRIITKRTKERKFDTRKGDTLPKRHLKEITAGYSGTFALARLYIYPGEEFEVPGFAHATGRRELRSFQKLMVTIVPVSMYAVPLPMSQTVFVFDSTITEPYVEISYVIRQGFMVYDGPREFEAKLHFRDWAQQYEYIFEFAPPTEETEEIAA